MNNLTLFFFSAIFIGLGATLTFDLWGLFLKYAFKVTPSNICLVGRWLRYPTPISAIIFGIVTVLAPFFSMQPAFGFGYAASKTSNPGRARIRSLMNHSAFGVGLYLFGLLANVLLRVSV